MDGLSEYLGVSSSETGEAAAPQINIENTESTETTVDESVNTGDVTGTGEEEPGDAEVVEQQKTSKQSPEQDTAFAKLRREAEDARRELSRRDAWVAQTYGHLGITTHDQLQQAIAAQQKQQEESQQKQREQQLRDAGYDENVISALRKVDILEQEINRVKQWEQNQKQQVAYEEAVVQLKKDHEYLKGKYGDLVPELDVLDKDEAIGGLVKRGYSLKAAWLELNEDAIVSHAHKAASQRTLNNVNSKQHLKPEGGNNSDIDTTVVPPETLRQYKALMPKATMQQIVDDYKKHNQKRR